MWSYSTSEQQSPAAQAQARGNALQRVTDQPRVVVAHRDIEPNLAAGSGNPAVRHDNRSVMTPREPLPETKTSRRLMKAPLVLLSILSSVETGQFAPKKKILGREGMVCANRAGAS